MCKVSIYFLGLTLFLLGCGGSNREPANISDKFALLDCSLPAQKQFVHKVMQDAYLYEDQLPSIDLNSLDSPQAVLNELRVEQDRFSTIIPRQQFDETYTDGRYLGFGFKFTYDERANGFVVQFVYPGSPAETDGMRRGDLIIAVESVAVIDIVTGAVTAPIAAKLMSEFLSGFTEGKAIAFLLVSQDGLMREVKIIKQWVEASSTLDQRIIHAESKASSIKFAYLALTAFVQETASGLADFYRLIENESPDELILDLRYNTGGLAVQAKQLASYIAGGSYAGQVFSRYAYNTNNRQFDTSLSFLNVNNSIGFKRVFVLTSAETCSASELLINSLKPYLNVVVIGDTTCGKPVGSEPIFYCNSVFLPIVFSASNVLGEGNYFEGIEPQCPVAEDYSHGLGDMQEAMLKEAVHYAEYGGCSEPN